MNLGQFHSRISNAIKRGTSLDNMIPLWVAEAAQLIEQNYSFSWMRRVQQVVWPSGDSIKNRIPFPSQFVKSFEYVRFMWLEGNQGAWHDIQGVDPRDVLSIDSHGSPNGYWLDGLSYLYFDVEPQPGAQVQIAYHEYTDWPLSDVATPALLQRGTALLTFETLGLFAAEMRDTRMAEVYAGQAQRAYNFLLRAEEELKQNHQSDLRMHYSGLR